MTHNCAAVVDRSSLCFRCGEPGHRQRGCPAAALKCALCAAEGRAADHVAGTKKCPVPKQLSKAKKAVAASCDEFSLAVADRMSKEQASKVASSQGVPSGGRRPST
ncbi:DNA-binding protein HEXBP-like, partial [Ostrinia furnacalis]|uniref:DNA-binding protein HEXBP-like n=1 Tax=Ostrinia furnacalis TaxID=93504 RepID=UPI0010402D8C